MGKRKAEQEHFEEEVEEKEQKRWWQRYLQYTADLDRLNGTDTFSLVEELSPYRELIDGKETA